MRTFIPLSLIFLLILCSCSDDIQRPTEEFVVSMDQFQQHAHCKIWRLTDSETDQCWIKSDGEILPSGAILFAGSFSDKTVYFDENGMTLFRYNFGISGSDIPPFTRKTYQYTINEKNGEITYFLSNGNVEQLFIIESLNDDEMIVQDCFGRVYIDMTGENFKNFRPDVSSKLDTNSYRRTILRPVPANRIDEWWEKYVPS